MPPLTLLWATVAASAAIAFGLAFVAGRLCMRAGITKPRYDLTGLVAVAALGVAAWAVPVHGEARAHLALLLGALPWALGALALGYLVDYHAAASTLRTLFIFSAGVVLQEGGVGIETVKLPFTTHFVSLGSAAPVITALWLLVFSVLFGRASTIAGASAGIATCAGLTFWAIAVLRPDLTDPAAGLLGLTLASACLPLIPLAPKLQHGGATAGGYVIGFLVGLVSIEGALKNTAFLIAAVPLLVVGAPLFAAAFTYVADLRSGFRAVAVARHRRHLHELLIAQGYTSRQVLQVILAGTVYLCLLAILMVAIAAVSIVVKLLLLIPAAVAGLVFFYFVLRMMHRPLPCAEGGVRAVNLMGVRLHPVTMSAALAEAERFIREDRPHMIVTTDASGFMRAQDDPEFREIVNQADLVTPDGAGVVLAARLLNIPIEARCPGCDMVAGLCSVAARLGRSVYLLGAAPGVAEKAAQKLQEQIPGLEVAGCHDGYFTEEQEPAIVEEIRALRPAVLFVALGIPRQEMWIRKHLQELNVPVCVGVGGSFDVISGLKKRAPVWMQRIGLEWLYRVAKEPRRLPRLAALPRIVLLAFAELLRPPAHVEEPPQHAAKP
jgi:N-acetylglucosaminyldiphosphoundecaprenol N-acetyl-beta-D-mannosaminyltransferase